MKGEGGLTQEGFPTILPALRDSQLAQALWLCPLCGQEQYHGDRGGLWHGRQICALCLSRFEKEEESP